MSQNGSMLLLIIITIVIIFKWLRAISKFSNKMHLIILSTYMLCGHGFHKLNGGILVGYDYNDPSK